MRESLIARIASMLDRLSVDQLWIVVAFVSKIH